MSPVAFAVFPWPEDKVKQPQSDDRFYNSFNWACPVHGNPDMASLREQVPFQKQISFYFCSMRGQGKWVTGDFWWQIGKIFHFPRATIGIFIYSFVSANFPVLTFSCYS